MGLNVVFRARQTRPFAKNIRSYTNYLFLVIFSLYFQCNVFSPFKASSFGKKKEDTEPVQSFVFLEEIIKPLLMTFV